MQLEQLLKSLQCWALEEHHGARHLEIVSNDNTAASAGGGQRYDTPRNWLKTLHDSVAGWQVS